MLFLGFQKRTMRPGFLAYDKNRKPPAEANGISRRALSRTIGKRSRKRMNTTRRGPMVSRDSLPFSRESRRLSRAIFF